MLIGEISDIYSDRDGRNEKKFFEFLQFQVFTSRSFHATYEIRIDEVNKTVENSFMKAVLYVMCSRLPEFNITQLSLASLANVYLRFPRRSARMSY